MRVDEKMEADFRRLGMGSRPAGRGLFGTLLALVTGTALLMLGFMFSLLVLAVVAIAGVLGFGYLWWKTRALRRQINEQMQQHQAQHSQYSQTDSSAEGVIIEGEVIREEHKLPR